MKKYLFKQAVPIWEKDKENEMNYHLLFRSILSENCVKNGKTKHAFH